MRRERAIEVLGELREEARTAEVMNGAEGLTEWKAKVAGVLTSALGPDDEIVRRFRLMKFSYQGLAWNGMDRSVYTTSRHARIRDACGLMAAAIHQLELEAETDEPVGEHAFDPDLWAFVRALVEAEDWGKVRPRPLSSSRAMSGTGRSEGQEWRRHGR